MDKELKQKMKYRDLLKKSWHTSGDKMVHSEYKKLRNKICTEIKSKKKEFYENKLNSGNAKTAWSTVHQLMKKQKNDFPQQMMIKEKLTTKPMELAEEMNSFFIKKVEAIKEKEKEKSISDEDKAVEDEKKYFEKKNKQNLHFRFKEVENEQMDCMFKKMKGKMSHGLDMICGYSLKLGFQIVKEELKYIIKLSIRSGKLCDEWKKTKVLPIFKNKGSRFDLSSYRPISNLSEVSKLCEMAIYDQVYKYFENNRLLHPDHHGFMKDRSTITAVQQLRDYWLKNADNGKLSSALLLDLRAGFDVINLSILQTKLKMYGFDDISLSWFKKYLE